MTVSRAIIHYGETPVPYTAAWSDEIDTLYLGQCPHFGVRAIRQRHMRGSGKPRFGSPHMDRQREVIARGLCDLCARPLKNRTKVSLSHARPQIHGAGVGDILQFEPLLHRECAAASILHCPSVSRDIANGSLSIRQVSKHAAQGAIMSEQGIYEQIGVREKALGHAKVQLIRWRERDLTWLKNLNQMEATNG